MFETRSFVRATILEASFQTYTLKNYSSICSAKTPSSNVDLMHGVDLKNSGQVRPVVATTGDSSQKHDRLSTMNAYLLEWYRYQMGKNQTSSIRGVGLGPCEDKKYPWARCL